MALIVEQKTCVRRFYVNLGLDVRGSSIGKHFRDKHRIVPKDLDKQFHVIEKCKTKFDCLVHEMLVIRELSPSLNVQSDSIRAKLFAWHCIFYYGNLKRTFSDSLFFSFLNLKMVSWGLRNVVRYYRLFLLVYVQQYCHCYFRGFMSHLLSGANRRAKETRVTTVLYLSPQHTTCLVFMSPCASLTKQKHCTRTSSGNILTMLTVSITTRWATTNFSLQCNGMQTDEENLENREQRILYMYAVLKFQKKKIAWNDFLSLI